MASSYRFTTFQSELGQVVTITESAHQQPSLASLASPASRLSRAISAGAFCRGEHVFLQAFIRFIDD